MPPAPSKVQQAEDYDQIWDSLADSDYQRQQHFKNRLYAIVWAMKRLHRATPKILEVGCGFGTIAGKLAEFGQVTANDLSPRAIDIAKERYPGIHFEAGDITEDSVATGPFDILVTTEVFEHVPVEARSSFVAALAERLHPGGSLILTTPNKQLSNSLDTFQLIEEHFSEDELRSALESHFEIEHMTTIHRLFPVLGHSSKFFQALRWGLYEVLRLRTVIEAPARSTRKGLYFLVIAKRRG